MLKHNRNRSCTRYGEPIEPKHADKRDGEKFHRCPSCGAALNDFEVGKSAPKSCNWKR